MSIESQFCKIITVLEMLHSGCLTLLTLHLKMVKKVNFKLCILYLKLKKKDKEYITSKRNKFNKLVLYM